jgi:hypothetical protein
MINHSSTQPNTAFVTVDRLLPQHLRATVRGGRVAVRGSRIVVPAGGMPRLSSAPAVLRAVPSAVRKAVGMGRNVLWIQAVRIDRRRCLRRRHGLGGIRPGEEILVSYGTSSAGVNAVKHQTTPPLC